MTVAGRPNSAVAATRPSARASVAGAGGPPERPQTRGGYEDSAAMAKSPAEPSQIVRREPSDDNADRPATGRKGGKTKAPGAVNEFTNLVERTVDNLKGNQDHAGYEDAQRILASIKRAYDEVHSEAEKKEMELLDIRKEVRLADHDTMKKQIPDCLAGAGGITREWITKQIEDVNKQMEESSSTRKVYLHMVARLKHEHKIVSQKIGAMETHLGRKTREVEQRQEMSRVIHGKKVQSILLLEDMEQNMEQERFVCNAALDDLELVLQQRRNEVRRREDFERWRYEVAMEAASEAFHAMAGRFRKIYAIEKLTGNCLQKIIFEQAATSQETEDGFQKIREVTGLTDVMDIVHKFLNRDLEHEQLRVNAREAEAHLIRLRGIQDAESNKNSEGMAYDKDGAAVFPRGLNAEVANAEQKLAKVHRDQEDFQQRLRNMTLLVDDIMTWARKMARSFSSFEVLDELDGPADLVPFFLSLKQTVERFFEAASRDMSTAKLSKITNQASGKQYIEQQALLVDKEFVRNNCRVPASLDAGHHHHHRDGHGARGREQEEDHANDVAQDRERLKQESAANVREKDRKNHTDLPHRQPMEATQEAPTPASLGDRTKPRASALVPPALPSSRSGGSSKRPGSAGTTLK